MISSIYILRQTYSLWLQLENVLEVAERQGAARFGFLSNNSF